MYLELVPEIVLVGRLFTSDLMSGSPLVLNGSGYDVKVGAAL
jgi:hypothetical protein